MKNNLFRPFKTIEDSRKSRMGAEDICTIIICIQYSLGTWCAITQTTNASIIKIVLSININQNSVASSNDNLSGMRIKTQTIKQKKKKMCLHTSRWPMKCARSRARRATFHVGSIPLNTIIRMNTFACIIFTTHPTHINIKSMRLANFETLRKIMRSLCLLAYDFYCFEL